MDVTRLWRLEGVVKPYAWGSLTAIPELLGREPTGEPQAELWLGAHPLGSAHVHVPGGESVGLDECIRRDAEGVLGAGVAQRFGGELPFLLKVLAAERPLSIQAHPDREQARAGFARENAAGIPLDAPHRCYRDPNHKPELICALTRFRALNRFREPVDICRRIGALAVSGLDPVLAPLLESPDRSGLATFFESWMTLDAARRGSLVEQAAERASALRDRDLCYAELTRLAHAHPGDAGVLAPLFLNLVDLTPGEAMYLPAGELHSYLDGVGIEIMASSDNVLRGGLTPKYVDVDQLVETLTFRSGPVERLRPKPVARGEARYETPAQEFALSALDLAVGAAWRTSAQRGVEILLCTQGRVRASDGQGRTLELSRGESLCAPAAAGSYAIEGDAIVYRAAVPAPSTDPRAR